MTRQELLDAVPGFVDAHWPKNDTAADGGEATPGRGEACVTITRFILEVVPPDDVAKAALIAGIRDFTDEQWRDVFAFRPDLKERLRACLART